MSKNKEFEDMNSSAAAAGGSERIAKQHAQGKLTATERVEALSDPGSFFEIDRFVTHRCHDFEMQERKALGDGVVAGLAQIAGRKVGIFAQDFTVLGGSLSWANSQKICKLMDHITQNPQPIIGLNDSGGARIQEGVESLAGYAEIFYRNVQMSGLVPQISLVMGPCAGGAVYSPALTDFIIMVKKTSHMFITGPEVIKEVTREEVTKDALGGSETHTSMSGVAHLEAENDLDALRISRQLLSYLPQSCFEKAQITTSSDPITRKTSEIESVLPESASRTYDVKKIITAIADDGILFELQPEHAKNIVIGFLRIGGESIGVVANQPKHLAGCLDINASIKAARFVRFCDAFNIPILTLVDVPGFLPGLQQELGGIIKHGSKLLFAFAEATVPRVTLILRKAYGGAYDVMNSKHIRSDFNFALPSAEVAVMGPDAAVNIVYRKELDSCSSDAERKDLRDKKIQEYRQKFASPWKCAELGFVDAVIAPEDVRTVLAQSFLRLRDKQRIRPNKIHANEPL
jgi:propionyl-CoA carboxylase beta chain